MVIRHEIAANLAYFMMMMKIRSTITPILVAAHVIAGAVTPLGAQENAPEPDDRLFPSDEELRELGDLAQQMMRDLAGRVEPMAERLKALVDDLDSYQSPEMLPNGDIIIRRRPDADPVEDNDDGNGIAL